MSTLVSPAIRISPRSAKPSPLVVFADDWGRHPSSAQHLVTQLRPERTVTWINTIGTRTPKWNLETVRRAWGKLRTWTPATPKKPLPAGLNVCNPRMWPYFSRPWDRALNRKLLTRALRQVFTPDTVAVTTLPIVADLMQTLPAKWIYYCVDDFSEWPGLDGVTLGRMERQVVARADRIIAVSQHLQNRIRCMGRESDLLTHGVDPDMWTTPTPRPAWDFPRPWVVFWGVVDARMDIDLVSRVAQMADVGSVILVGPTNEPDTRLADIPKVHLTGALPFAELPGVAQSADVLIMPYANLPVTQAMQPLKLKEYLATGQPVIVTNLPANLEWADAMDLADSPTGFCEAVARRLREGVPESQKLARERLHDERWSAKAEQFAEWIDAEATR